MRRLFRLSINSSFINKVDPPDVGVGAVVQTSVGKENENGVNEIV